MNYKVKLLLIFFLFLTKIVGAQNNKERLYDKIWEEIDKGNYDKGLLLNDSLFKLSNKNEDVEYYHKALNMKGNLYYLKDEYTQAKKIIEKNLKEIHRIKKTSLKSSLLIQGMTVLGLTYLATGEFEMSINFFYKALELAEKNNDEGISLSLKKRIAGVLSNLKEYDQAREYYFEIIKVAKESDEGPYNLSSVYENLALTYFSEDNSIQAEKYMLLAEVGLIKENKESLRIFFQNFSAILFKRKKLTKSLNYALKAFEISKEIQKSGSRSEIEMHNNLAAIYQVLDSVKKSKYHLNIADSLNEKINSLVFKSQISDGVSITYEELKDYKNALRVLKKHISFNDSLFNTERSKITQEIKTQYETSKKEAEIIYQKKMVNEHKKQKYLLGILGVFLIGLLGFGIYIYKERLKTQKKMFVNQNELNEQKVNSLIESQKLQSIQDYVDGQNNERERIAGDLHDGIGGDLIAIKMKLEKLYEEQPQEIKSILLSMERTYDEVRNLSHDLVSKNASLYRFTEMLIQFIDFSINKGVVVKCNFYPKDELNKLSEDVQHAIYRILQELITNFNKHAEGTNVFINITKHENGKINLMIEDNGKGFDVNNEKRGIGLESIKKRVFKHNGSVFIESTPNKGTVINIDIND